MAIQFHQIPRGKPKNTSNQNGQQVCVSANETSIEQQTSHDSMHTDGNTDGECDNTYSEVDINMPHIVYESDSTHSEVNVT